jgi:hypothetical protein
VGGGGDVGGSEGKTRVVEDAPKRGVALRTFNPHGFLAWLGQSPPVAASVSDNW